MSKLVVTDTVDISAERAAKKAETLFMAAGAPENIAREVADHLVDAEQSGVPSHGIVRILQYTREMLSGKLAPHATPEVVRERDTLLTVQAKGGIGIPAMRIAHELAAKAARENGLAAVALLGAGHTGRLGAFGEVTAAAGCLSITIGGGNREAWRQVAPYGGQDAVLPTNPYCIAIPGGDRGPVVLDAATSKAAGGWIYAARAAGVPLPEGLILDREGNPTTNPEDYFEGGAILPKGGPLGYGLALVAELIGEAMLGPVRMGEINWLILALDCSKHKETHAMQRAAEEVLSELRASTPARGHTEVLIPGERERALKMKARGEPLRIPRETWMAIEALQQEFT